MSQTLKGFRIHVDDSKSQRKAKSEMPFLSSKGIDSIASRLIFCISISALTSLFWNGKIPFIFNSISMPLNKENFTISK